MEGPRFYSSKSDLRICLLELHATQHPPEAFSNKWSHILFYGRVWINQQHSKNQVKQVNCHSLSLLYLQNTYHVSFVEKPASLINLNFLFYLFEYFPFIAYSMQFECQALLLVFDTKAEWTHITVRVLWHTGIMNFNLSRKIWLMLFINASV